MSGATTKFMAVLLAVVLLPTIVLAQGSAAKGKDLYAKQCAGCHGQAGKGDGPAAAAINPKPTNFTDKAHMTALKDQYLFELIQKGGAAVGKSPLMTPFGSKLKDGEIQDLIAYIRSLAK